MGAELHAFVETEALEALDHIIRRKPRIVALDHHFSSSSRGLALINRIKDDPALIECEVRVLAHEDALNHKTVRRSQSAVHGSAAAVIEKPDRPLDQRGTRRAPRITIKDGVEILVDGNAASLVDLSPVGAQVLCATVLRPNQRVRLTLADAKGTVRCSGSIAWAALELPKGQAPRYRAGIEIKVADPESIRKFAERHKRS
jgi:hypothetical protein